MNFDFYKNKNVLVTGASGFFASHLTKKLLSAGANVSITTKYNSVIDNIRLIKVWNDINVLEADLRNTDSLTQIKTLKPEIIFHFAAYNHVGDSFLHVQESLNSNALGSANLMEAYKDYERFVYIATSEVYGFQTEVPFTESMTPFPTSPYAVGKYAGELYARMQHHAYNLPIILMRPFNVFGPYQSPRAIIAELVIKCLKGETIRTTEGKQTRDFNFVLNLVDGVMLSAANKEMIGKITNLGSGIETPIKDLVKKIHTLTESKSTLEIGALPNRPTEIWRMQADFEKAEKALNWTPKVSLDDGLKITIEWFKRFLSVYSNPESPLLKL